MIVCIAEKPSVAKDIAQWKEYDVIQFADPDLGSRLIAAYDLDGDGEMNSEIALRIEYDREKYPDCNGFGGSYLDLYQAEFVSN